MNHPIVLLLLTSLLLVGACGSEPEPLDESREKLSKSDHFLISYEPIPDPIPFNELFKMEVTVADPGAPDTPIADAKVLITVDMPVHEHGMPTVPRVTPQEDGTFLVEGMKFHMRSTSSAEYWRVLVDVEKGSVSDTATFYVMCCQE